MEPSSVPGISGVSEEIREKILGELRKPSGWTGILHGRKVGISVSNNEELGILGYSEVHLRDITIEIARQLLMTGAMLVYGGGVTKKGFTELFCELAHQYRSKEDARKNHFINYFSFPIHCLITPEQQLEFLKDRTEIVKVPPPAGLENCSGQFISPDTTANKYIWARSLSNMRQVMIADSEARILVGGKLSQYEGRMPGIIEEAIMAIDNNKPVYIAGALGGSASQVVQALKGNGFSFLSNAYHLSEEHKSFKEYYNEREAEKIDLEKTAEKLHSAGISAIAKNNGLSDAENERLLFTTPHVSEMIYLIFKGLSTVFRKNT